MFVVQEAFLITLGKMSQILGLLVIGFVLRKIKVLPEQTPKVLSGLSAKLFLPCLMLYSNIEKCTIRNLTENASLLLYGLMFTLFAVAIGTLVAPMFERRNTVLERQYRYSLVVPNSGAAAIPLVMVLFEDGNEGVFLLGLYLLSMHVVTYSWGIMQLIPQGRHGVKGVLCRLSNPVMISILIGMALGLLNGNAWIPSPVLSLVNDLSGCYVLAAVLLVGYTVAGFDLKSVLSDVKIYVLTAVRLLGLPLLFMGLCRLMKVPTVVVLLTALVFAGPCGMNPIVFAAEHGLDSRKVSGLLVVTVVLSVVTLPLVYALAVFVTGG